MDKIKKMVIDGTEYTFKMTNKTVFIIDEKYGNYGTVLEGIMEGNQFYTNAIKILTCACVEKEWEFDELAEVLTGEQLNYEIPSFVTELYFNYIGVNEEEKTEKNAETSQDQTMK